MNTRILLLAALLAATLTADQDPPRRPDPPRTGGGGGGHMRGWDDQGRWGHLEPVERSMANLRRLSKRQDLDARTPMANLELFTRHLRQHGRFDRDRLDNAIQQIATLASSEQLAPRDRKGLASDVERLRKLRATDGDFSRWQ